MTGRFRFAIPLAGVALAGSLAALPARAEDPAPPAEPLPPWSATSELGIVWTSGNAETSTIGFKAQVLRRWEPVALLTIKAGAVKAESTTIERTATVTNSGNVKVDEDENTETTAENYFLNGQYDRKITEKFLWFVGAGWDRNEPAGVRNRYTAAAGLGNLWVNTDTVKFKTNYGLTGTKQDDVVENPDESDTFLGARLSYDYLHKFGTNTVYTSTLAVDDNLDETSDWRADMINAIAVSMNKRLALKVSLQWLYDNEPSLIEVDVDNPPVGGPETVFVEADDLDSIFTASLVVNF